MHNTGGAQFRSPNRFVLKLKNPFMAYCRVSNIEMITLNGSLSGRFDANNCKFSEGFDLLPNGIVSSIKYLITEARKIGRSGRTFTSSLQDVSRCSEKATYFLITWHLERRAHPVIVGWISECTHFHEGHTQ